MNEKRFRLVNELGDYHIKDGDDELCYDLCSPSMAKKNWNNVVNRLNELAEENKELEFQLKLCRTKKLFSRRELEKENKELKAMCEDYRKLSIQYSQKYNEKISDNTFLEEENTHIKDTIKQAYKTERTDLGKSTLKQLAESLGVEV